MRVACWMAVILAAGTAAASAVSPVPPSAMPGRERDRFTPSPVERFMQPGPYVSAPLVSAPDINCTVARHSKQRTKRAKRC